ncbi:TetR/AcrR family transcriptional regulator [Streptomyces sp. NPDC005438]|uniref:TetR/AcrR family transcriptional regulator n=1 Tax=Streptomyces sp. NPDC005438 TaxID=3156880 RepID=UPI0033BFAE6D
MGLARVNGESSTGRRAPAQQRSREKVRAILTAARELIVASGVEALSTRAVAERAGVPVASLYQYFAHKQDVVLALVEQDTQEMDRRLAEAVAALERPTVRAVVRATVETVVGLYRERPAFVVIWCQGRMSPAVLEYTRAHNGRIAEALHAFGVDSGALPPDTPLSSVRLAVETADRVLEFAFEKDLAGDDQVLREGIEMIAGYLERPTP